MTKIYRKKIKYAKTYVDKFDIIMSRNQYGTGFHETKNLKRKEEYK